MTRRLVPVLIVATVLALGATVAAHHPGRPVPASATAETLPVAPQWYGRGC